mgnify:CR=1 FL=1
MSSHQASDDVTGQRFAALALAKKIGLRDFSQGRVNDTETNVLLGTSYMRLVMENLDNHPVLASAAYNAGPGRAKKWKDVKPLEGAIYAECIPFNETRDYVKKVMANSIVYTALLEGRAPSLKARLGTISASDGSVGAGMGSRFGVIPVSTPMSSSTMASPQRTASSF